VDTTSNAFFSHPETIIYTFPQIKSWNIEGPTQALRMFDMRHAEKLKFRSQGSSDNFLLKFIPTQLTELRLDTVRFTPDVLSSNKASLMPNLVTLELCSVYIDGTLRRYFNFPNLKSLRLHQVWSSGTNEEGKYYTPVTLFSDELFFRSIPKLEYLALETLSTNRNLSTDLQHCPLLQEIIIDFCSIGHFVSSFIGLLASGTSFSSLKHVHIDSSWSPEIDISFSEFTATCARHRQKMHVSGNGRIFGHGF
jgi:hypothetical protein